MANRNDRLRANHAGRAAVADQYGDANSRFRTLSPQMATAAGLGGAIAGSVYSPIGQAAIAPEGSQPFIPVGLARRRPAPYAGAATIAAMRPGPIFGALAPSPERG